MNKCWFIWLNSKQEGPFSYEELETMDFLTPDTLVWREGMADWTPIRNVPELSSLFKEEESPAQEEEEEVNRASPQDEIAIPLQNAEPPLLLWVMIALVVLTYVLLKLSK